MRAFGPDVSQADGRGKYTTVDNLSVTLYNSPKPGLQLNFCIPDRFKAFDMHVIHS